MDSAFDAIFRRIIEVAPGLHSAGTFSPRTLEAIACAAGRRRVRNSAETGAGASTLLLSHLSGRHTVFALDGGSGSVENVRRSPLLRAERVTFVEGPTQATLPRHQFTEKLQLALIDGPHAYPFPDLEYYYLYPHLEPGALLIVDDIHIPTVHNLFRFLKRDAMFELDGVTETTAFFTRTAAPAFDPLGDGWERQRYNARPLLRYSWRDRLRGLLPMEARRSLGRLRRRMARGARRWDPVIVAPRRGGLVSEAGTVEGFAELPEGCHLWVLVHRNDLNGWWPQGGGPAAVVANRWKAMVTYGEARDAGYDFEIAALVVGQATHDLWTDWVRRAKESGKFPPVPLPAGAFVLGEAYRRVTKRVGEAL